MIEAWNDTSPLFKAKIIGKLLGDGSITKQEGRKPRFKFNHSANDYGWCAHCYERLNPEMVLSIPKYKKSIDSRLKRGYSETFYVQSRTSNVVSYLREKWYPEGKKIVPFDLLTQFFSAATLAWWYMDDGHLKIKDNIPEKIILSTDSFTPYDNNDLVKLLHNLYNLSFRIDKQNRLILYDQLQIHYFLYLVSPYLHPSMYRKSISYCNINFNEKSRRTTLYLSTKFKLVSPTKEINGTLNKLPQLVKLYKRGDFYNHYKNRIFKLDMSNQKSYQIIISVTHLTNLTFLKQNTGLTYSQLLYLCTLT